MGHLRRRALLREASAIRHKSLFSFLRPPGGSREALRHIEHSSEMCRLVLRVWSATTFFDRRRLSCYHICAGRKEAKPGKEVGHGTKRSVAMPMGFSQRGLSGGVVRR
jgi:hypothetical protein